MPYRLFLGMVLLAASLSPKVPFAQSPADTLDAAAAVERALEATDAATASTELAEWLADRVADPVPLNTASEDVLARLPGISPLVAQRIVAHREAEGPIDSLSTLRDLLDDPSAFRLLRPFVTVASPVPDRNEPSWHEALSGRFIQRITRRLDLGRGYSNDTSHTTYAGSPERLYTRLQLQAGRHFHFNMTLEKDPGERFEWAPAMHTYGFDHVTAHAALHNTGPIETLVVGDYTVAFGQGLSLWRSFSFSKGRDVIGPVARRGTGLTPSSSTEENRFFRGIGASVRLRHALSVTGFGSRRTLDATMTRNAHGEQVPTNLTTSGLHRTPTERAQKDAVRETLFGGALSWTPRNVQVGLAGYYGRFDRPLSPPSAPYRRFDPLGHHHTALSVYANVTRGDVYGFGEFGRTATGWGGIGGVQIDKTTADAMVGIRHYTPSFQPMHGRAFGEGGNPPHNETGLYLGLRVQPAAHWEISGYMDQYRFPWLRFATPRPSAGYDARLVVAHTPRPWLDYYVQVRSETREDGASVRRNGYTLRSVQAATRQSLRLHGEYTFSEPLRYRMRIEVTRYQDRSTTASGVLLYQGFRWHPADWLRLDTRWALFDSDDFNARLYAYEYDLLYTFSVPVFNGRGARQYVLMALHPVSRLHLTFKYSTTRYRDVHSVGSGLDKVDGSQLRTFRAQIRWQF